MNCEDFNAFLADYIEGELCDERRRVFEAHIHGCVPCVEFLEGYRRTVKLARACECPELEDCGEAPEGLVQAILASREISCEGASGEDTD